MKAIVLLCDHAVVAEGKLYINGGGISIIPQQVGGFSVAILVSVPWTEANRPIPLGLALENQDGQPVLADGQPIGTTGNLEVGRPAGAVPGTSIEWPFVFTVAGLSLTPGRYEWKLSIDGQSKDEWRAPFTVVAA